MRSPHAVMDVAAAAAAAAGDTEAGAASHCARDAVLCTCGVFVMVGVGVLCCRVLYGGGVACVARTTGCCCVWMVL